MNTQENIDRCVMCGQYVPEGSMVCEMCKLNSMHKKEYDIAFLSKEQKNIGAYLYDRDTRSSKKD